MDTIDGLSAHALVRRIDLFTLKLFLSTVEEGQIGRAAVREHIVASAATKRIQDLEELAGLKLLERNPKGVVPSAAGEVLASHIRMMLTNLDDMRREIGEIKQGVRGRVSISAPRLLITGFLGHEMGEFTKRFPLVKLELQEDTNANAIRALASGDVDLALFLANNVQPDTIDVIRYRADRLVAVLPRHHRLAGYEALTLELLLEPDFIAHSTTAITGIERAALGVGRELHVAYRVRTVESACSLVLAGLGVTVRPESMRSLGDEARLAKVPLTGDWAQLSHCIGTLRGRAPTAAAQALIDQLTKSGAAAR
ncbi:LysR family transcriptional regulator [Caballeronia ptereochthonis]|uniref:LysR family transcriptional regulator n=1 Tax=Caballeronia ptereochthonis TaxID=1777144 RepID=A0A158E177_9BURK|nr:LysR family transcriptional regulator [Caballeronia ptereochthonis]SAL00651.1 LysR family transcriptional regulator [Caballeronia ptereochthonis]